ncbi:MAG TPA: GNAT family N-acetyltransferase [Bacteroidia bacterium]|nr:GNAT family N-acetyltransferase [Bacteroidia bacterium]
MQNIIEPVDIKLLESELTDKRFVRKTNNGNNEIYIITHHDSPNVMREIGRLREVTFRAAGGGTGKDIDIDEFDTDKTAPYKQLIVWNPKDKDIVGGYRFIKCKEAPITNGVVQLATTELFRFSEKFIKEYVPYTIELGRSFVQPKYQPTIDDRRGIFSLDNLWDGLGAILVDNPDVGYFFGKVTMYTDFNVHARDLILSFMMHYFPDKENLVVPLEPLLIKTDVSEFLNSLKGLNYKDGHLLLNKNVRALGEHIPPLVNAYMNLSATMKTFGTASNTHFGEVEETGILVKFDDIYPTKKERHISTYHPQTIK